MVTIFSFAHGLVKTENYLEHGRHVARLHRRHLSSPCAPASNTASHDNHEKINSSVSFTFYGYGAPLGGLRPAELRDKETFVFWARVKGNFKLEQKNFSLYDFLAVQSRSLNSHYLYASVLKLIYLRHNIDCFIASHCLFKVQT